MLFNTVADIKPFWSVTLSDKFEKIKPWIAQAERDFIIPHISQEQYVALDTAFNALSMSAEQTALLAKVQSALALYTYHLAIPTLQLQISDSGIRIATNENLKTAFPWQIQALQESVVAQAGSAMESLLAFMEANKDDYPLWTDSNAYTLFKECFISSAKDFTRYYSALGDSRLSFLKLRSHMISVEERVLQKQLSTDFYDELKSQHASDSFTTENAKLLKYIKRAVANLTMANAMIGFSVTINEMGVLKFNNISNVNTKQGNSPAEQSLVKDLQNQALIDGRADMKELTDFLAKNINDYPTYATGGTYDDGTTDTTNENQTGQSYVTML